MKTLTCPCCDIPLTDHQCPECAGTWLEINRFEQLAADPDAQAKILSRVTRNAPPVVNAAQAFRCTQCGRPMRRFDYAQTSGVQIDMCNDHGIWFDGGELRRVLAFIQRGGLNEFHARRNAQPWSRRFEDHGRWQWSALVLFFELFLEFLF